MRLVDLGDERAARLDCIAAYARGSYFNVELYDRDVSLPWLNAIGPTERGTIGWRRHFRPRACGAMRSAVY